MAKNSNRTTSDGFISFADGKTERGFLSESTKKIDVKETKKTFDVIIIGAGFAGLIAARELSRRDRSVLIVEAKDRIGGRAFTADIDNEKFEIGATWVHWSQPHLWSEVTRYGLSLCESEGASADQIIVVLDQGAKRKVVSIDELYPKLFRLMNRFADVDGVQGRTVFPFPHTPLAARQAIETYDHLSMKDRLNQIDDAFETIDDEMKQILDAYLSMNSQCDLANAGFLDHLCFWALGDFQTMSMWDKTSRYKIQQGTTGLANAILDDCKNVQLQLSTTIESIRHDENQFVQISSSTGETFVGRSTIVTVALNALHEIQFDPPLNNEKQRAINEGQCRGGTKFWAKLQKPMGQWCGFAAHPNPITTAYTDDAEGRIVVGFGPDDALNIQDVQSVERGTTKISSGLSS